MVASLNSSELHVYTKLSAKPKRPGVVVKSPLLGTFTTFAFLLMVPPVFHECPTTETTTGEATTTLIMYLLHGTTTKLVGTKPSPNT